MTAIMDRLLLLLVLLSCQVSTTWGNEEPIIGLEPLLGDLYSLEGNNTFIACFIRGGNPRPSVTWYKGGSIVGREEKLTFNPARIEDSGQYKCRMSNKVRDKEKTVNVKIYDVETTYGFLGHRSRVRNTQKIEQIMTWYNTVYFKGTTMDKYQVLKAVSKRPSGVPGYEYDVQTGDLLIPTTALDKEGYYTLTSFNFWETTWSFNHLYVYVRPSDVRMTGLADHVLESDQIVVSCTVDRVKPANMTFTWSLASNSLEEGSHEETSSQNTDGTSRVTSTLRHQFIRRDDQQVLQCEALHGVDSMLKTKAEKRIVVYYKYQSKAVAKDMQSKPIEGNQKTLVCTVVGEGKPSLTSYKWYRGSEEIGSSPGKYDITSNELTIRNLSPADDGEYGCRIENDAGLGDWTAKYHLEVLYEPQVTMSGPTSMVEGEFAQISCSVDAKPDFTSLNWYRNNNLLPQQDGAAEYLLNPAKRTDKGTYKCEVTNEIGSSSQLHNLDVRYLPTGRPTMGSSPLVMKVETTQNLTCDTSSLTDRGNPPFSQFIWTRDGVTIPNNTVTLSLNPLVVTEGTQYACAVSNDLGPSNYSRPLTIIVQAPLKIEEGITEHSEYKPLYNDTGFSINYTVSGGSALHLGLYKSNNMVSPDNFTTVKRNVTGDFSYGQTSATKVVFAWRTAGKDLARCDRVGAFNGDYSFRVSGTVAGGRVQKTVVFRIAVQYPAMWKGDGFKDSSATKIDKTLVCDVCANPEPSDYIWTFAVGALPPQTTQNGNRLLITNVANVHFGTYECTVKSIINGAEYEKTFSITLEERGSPHKPVDIKVASRTSETLRVTWSPGFNGGYELTGYELQYRPEDDTEWVPYPDTTLMSSCRDQDQVCETLLTNLIPDKNYTIQVKAKNSRPVGDHYSEFVTVAAKTRAYPVIDFLPLKLTEEALTVQWKLGDVSQRRRRDVSSNSDVGLKVQYKEEDEVDYHHYPEGEEEMVALSSKYVVVPGQFDVNKIYTVMVDIYEGRHKLEALGVTLKTLKPGTKALPVTGAHTGTIAGVAVVAVLLVLLVVGGAVLWHRRRANKGSQVELRGKVMAGYQPVTNAPSAESLHSHPPNPTPEAPLRTDPRPPMTRPLKDVPRAAPNGQPFRESPYVNVQAVGDYRPDPTQDDNVSLYENVPKQPQYENFSFRSRPKPRPQEPDERPHDDRVQESPKSPDRLIYTEVAFNPATGGRDDPPSAPRIHGLENRVEYSQLDFKKMPPPQRSESQI